MYGNDGYIIHSIEYFACSKGNKYIKTAMDAKYTKQQMLELTLDNFHDRGIPTNSTKTQRTTNRNKKRSHYFFLGGALAISTRPLLCHVANHTPHLAQWCLASLSDDIMYGRHPMHKQQQSTAAHPLLPLAYIQDIVIPWA